jgi:hypothetical protein
MTYEGKKLDALIAQYDKTGDPDNADFIRRYSKFGNGRRVPSRPRSLGERWAEEAKMPHSFEPVSL